MGSVVGAMLEQSVPVGLPMLTPQSVPFTDGAPDVPGWTKVGQLAGGRDGIAPHLVPNPQRHVIPATRITRLVAPLDVEGLLDLDGQLLEVT